MANNIIFYFTGTGNSLKVSKDIANVLENCEIISMPAFSGNSLNKKYERIGFVFPVYSFGIPNAVKKFIAETGFPDNNDAYFFAVATHGGVYGDSITMLKKQLLQKGIRLNACFDVKMVATYICMCDMAKNTEKTKKKVQVKIDWIKESVKNKTPNKMINSYWFTWFAIPALKSFPIIDKYYTISDKCSGCGICSKVCPVKNIEMENDRPVFKHNCEQCTSCIMCCPVKALNYKNKTQKRKRYINPEITINEIINGNKIRQ